MAQKSRDVEKALQLLLVEDSPADVLLIRESLMSCSVPVHVTVAYDGAKALSFLNGGFRPDLVILDLNIPKISGLELLEQYHEREIPIVVFSSSQNPQHKKAALERGAREYVHKPIDLEAFKVAVCDMVEKWGMRNGNGVTVA
jgi:CheY-like chemotaxis protein